MVDMSHALATQLEAFLLLDTQALLRLVGVVFLHAEPKLCCAMPAFVNAYMAENPPAFEV